jgi:hypothetical protein
MQFAALHESANGVRREKAALSSGCKAHPATDERDVETEPWLNH